MICVSCSRASGDPLCGECRILLRPAPDRFLPGVGVVRAGFLHEGVARRLVHHLKYRGVVAAASLLASEIARFIPDGVVLAPVPRVLTRRLRYGVDPALELARAVGSRVGVPVWTGLAAPVWGRPRAGRAHGSAPRYRVTSKPPPGLILVDDVVTSGATLVAAARLLPEVAGAVTGTSSMFGGGRSFPSAATFGAGES